MFSVKYRKIPYRTSWGVYELECKFERIACKGIRNAGYEKYRMPKRKDIHKILIIGSGPIVIGQGCEFDYSGTQGCKVLKQQGYKIVLINSNPATIMTDPGMADRTYIEPITPEII